MRGRPACLAARAWRKLMRAMTRMERIAFLQVAVMAWRLLGFGRHRLGAEENFKKGCFVHGWSDGEFG